MVEMEQCQKLFLDLDLAITLGTDSGYKSLLFWDVFLEPGGEHDMYSVTTETKP